MAQIAPTVLTMRLKKLTFRIKEWEGGKVRKRESGNVGRSASSVDLFVVRRFS